MRLNTISTHFKLATKRFKKQSPYETPGLLPFVPVTKRDWKNEGSHSYHDLEGFRV